MRKSATTTVASPLMLIMTVFEVVVEKRENGARDQEVREG